MKRDTGIRAGMLVSLIFAISALLGFARELVLAAFFGTSHQADALLVALVIPNTFIGMLSEASFGVAVLPVFISNIAPRTTAEQRHVVGSLFMLASLLLVPVTVLLILATPWLARIFAPGFSPADTQLTVGLMRLMLPSVFFLGIANVTTGLLYAFRRFGAPSAAGAVLNLAIVVTTIPLAQRYGVFAPALGVLIGSVVQLAIQLPPLFQTGLAPSIGFRFRDPAFPKMWSILWPILVALVASEAYRAAEKIVASFLPVGSIAALNYADKIAGGPARIFGMAISVVVFPALAEKASSKGSDMADTLVSGLNAGAVLTIPWLAIFIVLARPIVELLLQRGAFDAHATLLVTLPMIIYCFSSYAGGIATSVNRAFFAQHDSRTPMIVGTGCRFLGLAVGLPFIPLMSHSAIALGATIGTNLTLAALLWRLRLREHALDLRRFVATLTQVILASAAGALVAWTGYMLMGRAISIDSSLTKLIALSVAFVVGLAAYLAAGIALRIPEMFDLIHRIKGLALKSQASSSTSD